MMDLVNKTVGTEGLVDLKLEGGNVVLTFTHTHASGNVTLVMKENAKYFLDKLKVAIPGNWDDLVIGMLETQIP